MTGAGTDEPSFDGSGPRLRSTAALPDDARNGTAQALREPTVSARSVPQDERRIFDELRHRELSSAYLAPADGTVSQGAATSPPLARGRTGARETDQPPSASGGWSRQTGLLHARLPAASTNVTRCQSDSATRPRATVARVIDVP